MLVLYTDGVIEAFDSSGEEFGEERLMDTLCSHRSISAPLIPKAIVDKVAEFGGREQFDDITVVVAKKIARSSNASFLMRVPNFDLPVAVSAGIFQLAHYRKFTFPPGTAGNAYCPVVISRKLGLTKGEICRYFGYKF